MTDIVKSHVKILVCCSDCNERVVCYLTAVSIAVLRSQVRAGHADGRQQIVPVRRLRTHLQAQAHALDPPEVRVRQGGPVRLPPLPLQGQDQRQFAPSRGDAPLKPLAMNTDVDEFPRKKTYYK